MLPLKMEWINSTKVEFFENFSPDLVELKKRCLRSILFTFVVFLGCGYRIDKVLPILLYPTTCFYPHLAIVSTALTAPFFLTWSLVFRFSLCSAFFWVALELCCFIWPGLYALEKKKISFLVSFFLCSVGIGQYLGWRYLFPLSLRFFLEFNKSVPMPFLDLKDLLGWMSCVHQIVFFISLWPAFFLIPYCLGWVSSSYFSSKRPYIYVLSFFIGMIVTPPDMFLQICVAVPLIVFYEILVLFLYLFSRF